MRPRRLGHTVVLGSTHHQPSGGYLITIVETYRGIEILRAVSSAVNTANISADLAPPLVQFHAMMPDGSRLVAQSIEAVRILIDGALGSPEPA